MAAHTDGEQKDDAEERQIRITGAQAAQMEDTSFERDVLEYLAESDLDDQKKRILRDYLSRDWVFANIGNAEYHELKWELRVLKEILYLHYPAPDCLVTGPVRAAINDDPQDMVEPLTQEERLRIETFFRNIRLRLTRSKGMKQQQMLRTSIAQTEVRRNNEDAGGGIRGKILRR